MKMTKEEYRRRWELDGKGGHLTWGDAFDCAIDWGICKTLEVPLPPNELSQFRRRVLEAAGIKEKDHVLIGSVSEWEGKKTRVIIKNRIPSFREVSGEPSKFVVELGDDDTVEINPEINPYKGKENEIANLGEIRSEYSLKQADLAKLSGITQPYLSEMETDRKPFTSEASIKLFKGFNRGILGVTFKYKSAGHLRAAHIASFYKKDKQEEVYDLLCGIYSRQSALEAIDIGELQDNRR